MYKKLQNYHNMLSALVIYNFHELRKSFELPEVQIIRFLKEKLLFTLLLIEKYSSNIGKCTLR